MVGYDIEKKHREMFVDLLGVTYLRGKHSTGVFTAQPLAKKDSMKIKKMVVSSPAFIDIDLNSKVGSILMDPWADLVMAHCRYATVGEINQENAHPFVTDTLVGAHNGTLNDWWAWGNKGVDEHKSDSQIMFERMNKNGVEEVLKDLTDTSAWAISVYLKKAKKLILARNKLRPLYVGFVKDAGVMLWSSEPEMLEFAASRNDIPMNIYHLEKNKMYVIDPFEVRKGEESPWKIVDVPPKVWTSQVWKGNTAVNSNNSMFVDDGIDWSAGVPEIAIKDSDLSNEQCCTCDRQLTVKDVNNLTPVDVDGIKYFCCEECSQEAKEKLQEEVAKEKVQQQNSRFVDAHGKPVIMN
jgi:hypothetical protein